MWDIAARQHPFRSLHLRTSASSPPSPLWPVLDPLSRRKVGNAVKLSFEDESEVKDHSTKRSFDPVNQRNTVRRRCLLWFDSSHDLKVLHMIFDYGISKS
jgi:hypothetical protein